jgi:hypothetical protein
MLDADGRTDRQLAIQTDIHTNVQTYMTNVIVAFRNFANAPRKFLNHVVLQTKFRIYKCFHHIFQQQGRHVFSLSLSEPPA